jgi:hypothetical protein
MYRKDGTGSRVGLRYFYSLSLGLSPLLVNLWATAILVISTTLVTLDYSYCMVNDHASWDPVFGLPDYSWEYLVVKRAHLVVHVLRCVNGLSECLHVKVSAPR